MSNSSLTVQVPGKLMVAGEFAVLKNYQKLVVMAIDRYVRATISDHPDNRLTLESFGLYDMSWNYRSGSVRIDTNDRRVRFVEEAMTIVYTYLQEQSLSPDPFHLAIQSDLEDASGKKYGLGSSAAVVTSVVAAMLKKFSPSGSSQMLIFKLAAIAHVRTQKGGSGADIAASSFGGWLEYSSFQPGWLRKMYKKASSLTELATRNWPFFSVKSLQFPDDLHICIGWTGSPAKTQKLVDHIFELHDNEPALFQKFLTDSGKAVDTFLQGVREIDRGLVIEGTTRNRKALATVGRHAGVPIETPQLTALCDLAETHGGGAKPSGAGGGDCGIAFMPTIDKAEAVLEAWRESGIQPLAIQPNETGAVILD